VVVFQELQIAPRALFHAHAPAAPGPRGTDRARGADAARYPEERGTQDASTVTGTARVVDGKIE
jgi:hypothetical protein